MNGLFGDPRRGRGAVSWPVRRHDERAPIHAGLGVEAGTAEILRDLLDALPSNDAGAKLAFYKTIPSLRECIIVSHRERRITVHARGEGEEWQTRVAVTGGRVGVPSLQVELVVDEIYRLSEVR